MHIKNNIFCVAKTKATQNASEGVFRNEEGAIDLASIMVGIIVIGLIGGVIAATVFAVIPWAQDNAAKHQLDSIVAAESAYMGLASDSPPALPAGHKANSFADSAFLASASLLQTGKTYCAVTDPDGKSYQGYSQSASGKVWSVTDKNTKPVIHTGTLPASCTFITESFTAGSGTPAAYVDPTPTLTKMTYRCDTTVSSGAVPMFSSLTGTETWSDGLVRNYNYAGAATARSFTAGVTYTVTFDGTYTKMGSNASLASSNLMGCLRSVEHWGSGVGVIDATQAFYTATNLTDVPDNIPGSITQMTSMFRSASSFNDPSVSGWNVSNVTGMEAIFMDAPLFNQSLNSWNVSNITLMGGMFYNAVAFNQPLDKWNTSKVTHMAQMFYNAKSFNQPLNTWNTSQVTHTFQMFEQATTFNQPLDKWSTGLVISMSSMFSGASAFNQNLSTWNVSNVTEMSGMFRNAVAFNGNIATWNTSKVVYMDSFILGANAFNQNLSHWNTTALVYGTTFANASYNTSYLPPKTTL